MRARFPVDRLPMLPLTYEFISLLSHWQFGGKHAKQWPQAYGCKTAITQDPFARLEPN